MAKQKVTDTRSQKTARRFRFYKWIAVGVLALHLILGFTLFRREITVENLRYLIKYLDFTAASSESGEVSMHFGANPANRFAVFRGDLALVNESGVTLFDRRGSAVMTDRFSMANPVCVCGNRYLVVYDLGGFQVRVYNSFSLLFEKTFDYPVQSCDVNSGGDFCVVTSEKSYHAAVLVYDSSFREVRRFLSAEEYVYSAALSDYGTVSVSTVQSEQGTLTTKMILLSLKSDDPVATFQVADQMPLSHALSRKGDTLFTDRELIYAEKGEIIRSVRFPSRTLGQCVIGSEICAAVQDVPSVGVSFQVRLFNRRAEEIYAQEFSTPIRDLKVFKDKAYVLTGTALYELCAGEEMREYPLEGDYSSFGVLSHGVVVLCADASADIKILN